MVQKKFTRKKFLPERLEHQSKPIIRFQQTDWSNSNHHYNGFERRLVCVVLKFEQISAHFTTESGTFSCLKSNRSGRKIFENTIQMPFEGHMFNAPIGYHDFLTQMYGDYMQMPPKEKQVSNHDFEAYWRD